MKKLLSLLLTLSLTLSLTVTALADGGNVTVKPDGETLNQTQDINVTTIYQDLTTKPEVYSVDIQWGGMDYTYTVSGTREWNAETHEYKENVEKKWTCTDPEGSKVMVTNHSNAEVTVDWAFAANEGFETVTGRLYDLSNSQSNKTSETLAAATEGTQQHEAPSIMVYLEMGGELPTTVTELDTIGTVTITIS